jgi:hypothetical protein
MRRKIDLKEGKTNQPKQLIIAVSGTELKHRSYRQEKAT